MKSRRLDKAIKARGEEGASTTFLALKSAHHRREMKGSMATLRHLL
jgi:hypothetical protein